MKITVHIGGGGSRKLEGLSYITYVESEKVKPVKNRVKWWLPGIEGWG